MEKVYFLEYLFLRWNIEVKRAARARDPTSISIGNSELCNYCTVILVHLTPREIKEHSFVSLLLPFIYTFYSFENVSSPEDRFYYVKGLDELESNRWTFMQTQVLLVQCKNIQSQWKIVLLAKRYTFLHCSRTPYNARKTHFLYENTYVSELTRIIVLHWLLCDKGEPFKPCIVEQVIFVKVHFNNKVDINWL